MHDLYPGLLDLMLDMDSPLSRDNLDDSLKNFNQQNNGFAHDGIDDEDEEDDTLSMSDEQMFMKEHCKHVEQEVKVQEAVKDLRAKLQRKEEVSLQDIRGDWTLYSSEYLAIYANKPDIDIDELYDWTAGELRIGERYLRDTVPRNSGLDVGLRLNLEGGPIEGYNIDLKTPKFASLDPSTQPTYDARQEHERCYPFSFTFLGSGFLELRIPDYVLTKDCSGLGHVVFVGILSKPARQLEREGISVSLRRKNGPPADHYKVWCFPSRERRADLGDDWETESADDGSDDSWETESDEE